MKEVAELGSPIRRLAAFRDFGLIVPRQEIPRAAILHRSRIRELPRQQRLACPAKLVIPKTRLLNLGRPEMKCPREHVG